MTSGGEERVAGPFAALTGLSADTAVFVVLGVALALLGAPPAGQPARLQHGPGEAGVVLELAGQDPSRRRAHVGAAQVGADAAAQDGHVIFTEAGVGAGGAGLNAVEAGFDAGGQVLPVGEGHGPASVGRVPQDGGRRPQRRDRQGQHAPGRGGVAYFWDVGEGMELLRYFS